MHIAMLVYCLVSIVPKSNRWHKGLLVLFSTWSMV